MILPEGNVLISFSGGRTSGYMLHRIVEANEGLPSTCKVLFTNTGREMPGTLDFVRDVGKHLGVDITWLEYDRAPSNRYINGTAHFKKVNWDNAAREGEPFDKYLSFNMLPNVFRNGS